MSNLDFTFFKIIDKVEINITLKVSFWLDGNTKYLMPCKFSEVQKEDDFYLIKVEALDPDNFLNKDHIERKFLFGHPGKIIGYGILQRIL